MVPPRSVDIHYIAVMNSLSAIDQYLNKIVLSIQLERFQGKGKKIRGHKMVADGGEKT